MSADKRIPLAIQALYDAALDETQWTAALEALTAATGSQAATFWVLDSSAQPRLPTLSCLNFDPAFIAEYQNLGMVPLDPTVQYLVAHPHTPIVHDGLVITEREKDRHLYYDWHGRHSDTRYRMVGQCIPASKVQAGVALHRTRRVGRFEAGDIDQFAELHEHLRRALAIAYRLGTLGTLRQCTVNLLDQHATAIVLLDERRAVAYSNRVADAISAQNDGVTLTRRGLQISNAADHARLQGLIGGAMPQRMGTPVGGVMRAERPSGKQAFGIFVAPISRDYPALTTFRPVVCVMVTDPEHRRVTTASRLRLLFGLTEAEARLANALAAGDDLRAAAVNVRISYGTARKRLIEIFQKTNTHRQTELVALLLNLSAID